MYCTSFVSKEQPGECELVGLNASAHKDALSRVEVWIEASNSYNLVKLKEVACTDID